MMSDLSGLVLDAIVFLTNSKNPVAVKLAEGTVSCLEAEDKNNLNPATILYWDVLKLILEEKPDTRETLRAALKLKFKTHPGAREDPEVLDNLIELTFPKKPYSVSKLNDMERYIRGRLIWITGERSLRNLNRKSWKLGQSRDATKSDVLLNDILDEARNLVRDMETTTYGAEEKKHMDEVTLTDHESVSKAIISGQERRQTENMIKTGLQGMNNLLDGGFTLGEFVGVGALSHQYKSGMLMNLVRWGAVHNKPTTVRPGAVPTILLISLENELDNNSLEMHRAAYANAFHVDPPADMPREQLFKSVVDLYSRNGFNVVMIRRCGDNFGFAQFLKEQERLKANGCHVLITVIDYVQLMSKNDGSSDDSNDARKIQNMFGRLRDFFNTEMQLGITGIQLNRKAEQLMAMGNPYAVRDMTADHIGDCTAIKRELDALFFQHIVKNINGRPFLTFAWNKRRYFQPPDEVLRIWPFTPTGLMDDLGGKDSQVFDINDFSADAPTKEQTPSSF